MAATWPTGSPVTPTASAASSRMPACGRSSRSSARPICPRTGCASGARRTSSRSATSSGHRTASRMRSRRRCSSSTATRTTAFPSARAWPCGGRCSVAASRRSSSTTRTRTTGSSSPEARRSGTTPCTRGSRLMCWVRSGSVPGWSEPNRGRPGPPPAAVRLIAMPYLDHAATTPIHPQAAETMAAELAMPGNASSLHASGRRARRVVEESRESIAAAFGARPSEVVFTSGGTESDNLAVKGIYWSRRAADPRRVRVLASAVEHHAVMDSAEWLAAAAGATVTWLPVDAPGRVAPATLRELLAASADDVALVSVMWANNEVGTVQPVAELAEIAHEYDVPIHTDAVQAVGQLPVDFAVSGVDAMTITGHKFGGPVGAGVLLLGRDVDCVPVLHGGGQERDVRSGTLDVPAVAALATASEIAVKEQPLRAERLLALRDDLVARVRDQVPDALLNGDDSLDPSHRLPGNAHFSFAGCEGDALLMLLDARGIECSTGSACSAGVARPSHVLLAMGQDEARARASLRFTLGHTSVLADVDALAEAIGPVVERARAAAGMETAAR